MHRKWWVAVVAGGLALATAACSTGKEQPEGSNAGKRGTGTAVQQVPANTGGSPVMNPAPGMKQGPSGAAMNHGQAGAMNQGQAAGMNQGQAAGMNQGQAAGGGSQNKAPATAQNKAPAQPATAQGAAQAAAQLQGVKFDRQGNEFVVTNQSKANWTQVRVDVDGFMHTLTALNAGQSTRISAGRFKAADGKAYVPAASGFKKVKITATVQGKELSWQGSGGAR